MPASTEAAIWQRVIHPAPPRGVDRRRCLPTAVNGRIYGNGPKCDSITIGGAALTALAGRGCR
jgi:hypothetical protein